MLMWLVAYVIISNIYLTEYLTYGIIQVKGGDKDGGNKDLRYTIRCKS